MTALVWNEKSVYEYGISKGVLYVEDEPGVVWNGLISVEQLSVGGDRTAIHFEGIKSMDEITNREFQASITAFSHPREFNLCLGNVEVLPGFILTRQTRRKFNLCYRTEINERDYKLHLVYNCTVTPGAVTRKTLTDRPEAVQSTWTVNAVPFLSNTHFPTAHLILDSRRTPSGMLELLEESLYGSGSLEPTMPDLDTLEYYLNN